MKRVEEVKGVWEDWGGLRMMTVKRLLKSDLLSLKRGITNCYCNKNNNKCDSVSKHHQLTSR